MRLLRYTQLLEQLVGDLNQAPTTAENTLRAPVTSVTGVLFFAVGQGLGADMLTEVGTPLAA